MQRVQIESFRDSLATVTDSFQLLIAERVLVAHASHELRDSAMAHLRLGFIAMRLGDLSGKQHFDAAASEFQWATDLQPKWPYAWFGLGLAELGVGDAEFSFLRGLQTALGKDALTRSANDFARSAEVDPSFVRGLVELSNTALRQRVNLRMDVALAALRRSARTPAARNPAVQLVRARIEREVGSPDSALAAVDSLVAHHPTDAAGLLEQARVRFRLGRADGSVPWYQGLERADSSAVALYRADLRFVLPDSTLQAFDAAAGAERVTLMRRFWNLRDRDELRAPGDRLVEHYRRIDVARHNYRLASVHRHYDIIERYRPPVQEFDDRGVVYIRQGEPDGRATLAQPGIANNESWVYHRGGEPDLLFHFVAREGVGDYRLVESILDIVGYANAVGLQNSGDIQGASAPLMPRNGQLLVVSSDSAASLRQRSRDFALSQTTAAILRSRTDLSPIYQRMLTSGKGGAGGFWTEERARSARRSIRVGTTTDRWERHYDTVLPADVQLLTASRDSIHPVVEVAYAIPVDGTQGAPQGGGRELAPRVRVSVLGLDDSVVSILDTVPPKTRGVAITTRSYLEGIVPVPEPAGHYTVRVGLELERAGVVSGRDTVIVPDPAGPALGLSDLALGAASLPLWWISNRNDTIRVNPVAEFHAGEPIELSFELEGLVPDSSYKIEMLVRKPGGGSPFRWLVKLFGGDRDPFTVATTQRATAGRVLIQQRIALRERSRVRFSGNGFAPVGSEGDANPGIHGGAMIARRITPERCRDGTPGAAGCARSRVARCPAQSGTCRNLPFARLAPRRCRYQRPPGTRIPDDGCRPEESRGSHGALAPWVPGAAPRRDHQWGRGRAFPAMPKASSSGRRAAAARTGRWDGVTGQARARTRRSRRLSHRNARPRFAALGRDIFVAPALDLAKSAEVDSTFPYGVLELGENALNLGISSHLTGALMALREVARSPAGRDSAVLMLRGRIEREVGDVDSSIAAFQALLSRNRFNATALLEVARTKLAAGRINGVDQWYLGAPRSPTD